MIEEAQPCMWYLLSELVQELGVESRGVGQGGRHRRPPPNGELSTELLDMSTEPGAHAGLMLVVLSFVAPFLLHCDCCHQTGSFVSPSCGGPRSSLVNSVAS